MSRASSVFPHLTPDLSASAATPRGRRLRPIRVVAVAAAVAALAGVPACDASAGVDEAADVSCDHAGQGWVSGSERPDEGSCGVCRCEADGAWSCAPEACPVTCIEQGEEHPVGAVITREPTAEECTCEADGGWRCMPLGGCLVAGPPNRVPVGRNAPAIATGLAERADDRCNVCTCTPSFGWDCTDHACDDVCLVGSIWGAPDVHQAGDVFTLGSGARCTCDAPGCGAWVIARPCPGEPEGCSVFEQEAPWCGEVSCDSAPETCTYEGDAYALTKVFPGANGCDLCRCDGTDAVTCEERACPVTCDAADPCDPGCSPERFVAFTDSAACEQSGGVQCPTGQVDYYDPECGCGCEPAE